MAPLEAPPTPTYVVHSESRSAIVDGFLGTIKQLSCDTSARSPGGLTHAGRPRGFARSRPLTLQHRFKPARQLPGRSAAANSEGSAGDLEER
jgi:hypothetical protein